MSRIDDFIKKHLGDASHGQQQTKPMHPTQSAQSTGESSVGDLIKKHLGTAYGSEQQTHTAQPSQASGSAVDDFIGKYYTPVDNNYIYSYITDWDNYVKDAKTAYDGLNWESATSGALDRFNDTEKDLSSRAAAIRSYVEAHKNDYGEEQYKNIISQLDEMATFQSTFQKGVSEAKKYYSRWATEDDYNSYIAQQKEAQQFIDDVNALLPSDETPAGKPIASASNSDPIAPYETNFTKRRIAQDTAEQRRRIEEITKNSETPEEALAAIQEASKVEHSEQSSGYFQPGALSEFDLTKYFQDGWQKGDLLNTIIDNGGALVDAGIGTVLDAVMSLEKGVMRTSERVADTAGYGFADVVDFLGAHDYAKDVRKNASESYTDLLFEDDAEYINQYSVLGQKSDSVIESVGQAATLASVGQVAGAAGLGTLGSTLATSGATFLSSYGSGMSEAYQNGANDLQAAQYALSSGAIDTVTEMIFGGLGQGLAAVGFGKGLSSADDMFAGWLTKDMKNQIAKNIVQYGIKSGAEGLEELIAGIASAWAKSDTYLRGKMNFWEVLSNENLLEQFMMGTLTSGIMQAPGLVGSTMAGADFVSAPAQTNPGTTATPDVSTNAAQTPQSTPTAEKLSGITQDGNAVIPGTAGQETEANAVEQTQQGVSLETNAVTKPLDTYPAEKQKTIRSYLQSVDEQLKALVQRIKSGDLRSERKKISDVSTRAASDIKEILGIDVSGYTHNINASDIKHILNRHGENGEHDTTMSVDDDIARVGWVLENYDRVELLTKNGEQVHSKLYRDKNHNPAPQVRFIKKIDGTYYVVEAVCENKHQKFWVQSAYLQKNEDVTQASAESQTANHMTYAQSEVASPSSVNIIPTAEPIVNPDIASPENSTTSVGAAPAGFDPLTHAMVQYGNIPEGENAVRDDSLPVSMDGESKVSWVARTALGAEATPDAYAENIRKEVADGNLSYIPITNDATVQKAEKHIRELGWQEAYADWVARVERGEAGAEMSAIGSLLLNNAANAGDHKSWRNILYHFQTLGTNTAQGLQAFRILKTLSPSDKLWMVEKSAQQMVKDLGLDVEITLDEALVEEYDNAQTDGQREAALDKIIDSVAEQIPSKFMEKVNSIRYMNMLGNLRTQIRNLTGNASMAAVTSVKNTVATALERIVHFVSGGKTELTKSFTVSKEMMQSGLQDFDNVESIVNSGGRYSLHDSETSDIKQRIQDKRKIFNFKLAEWYRKGTNWAMDKGDVLFSKPAYARALAGYLKAHGVTDADFSKVDPELMDNARLYAVKQAQEQTFRDTNAISQWVSKIGRRKDTPAAAKILAEGVLPFRKTPANIAVRAWEYSPLGVINSVVDTVNAARSGSDTTAADAINSWAKTLTGGGLIGLGMLLQSLGFIRGTEDDDEQRSFDSLNGWQEYSLVLPDGTNLTIDALSPAALPLLVGAQMKAVIDGEGFSLDQVLGAMSALADPMVDMSLMSGIKSLIEDIRYSEEPLGQIAVNTLIDYATQIVTNSLVGQLERSTEKQRMQTYVDPDSSVPDWIQKALGGISAKTPGWDYQQIPYINAWGEKEETPTGLNLLENTVSPFYFDQSEKTPLTEELNRLYNDAQITGVYPSRPDKKQTYTDKNGVKHKGYGLDAQEYVEFATVQGQTQNRILDEMISSDAYKSLPDAYKADAIKKVYYYARETARKQVLSDTAAFAESKWMSEISGSEAETILSRVHLRYLTDQVIPEAGHQSARQVQIVEQIAADDGYTEDEQEAMLLATLTEAKAKAYDKVKGMGYNIDDFATVYRIYQKADDSKTYNKEHAIRDIARTLGVSEATATTLYEAYG